MADSLFEQLVLHLQESGVPFGDLAGSGLMDWAYARDVGGKSAGFSILIPCADASGHYWGFYEHRVREDGSEHSPTYLAPLLRPSVYPNRLRRIIFPMPNWPQDFQRHRAVLLAQRPWDVVVLHNVGLTNVVHLPCNMSERDGNAMRTARALGKSIMYPLPSERSTGVTQEAAMKQLRRECERVNVLNLEGAENLSEMLYRQGHEAILKAMDKAVSLGPWLHS